MPSYQKLPVYVVKYTICLILIFAFVYIIPNNKLNVKDSFVLSLVVTLSIAVLEHVVLILCPDPHAERFEPLADPTAPQLPTPVESSVKTEVPPTTDVKPVEKDNVAPKAQPPEAAVSTVTVKVPENTGVKDTIESKGSRAENDVIDSDMPYTDYHHLPLGDYYRSDMFEYGYSFLPPEKWYPEPPFPPVCVSEKRCPVCPAYTTGAPVDVKEWLSSSRITPPDRINTEYIKEKLNAGR